MTNNEAIEILKKKIVPCVKHSAWEEAVHTAISALEKQEADKPIGIKVDGKDPYTEIADIVDGWCQKHYYSSAVVTLLIDGRVTTEYLSFGSDTGFVWDMDLWEGDISTNARIRNVQP